MAVNVRADIAHSLSHPAAQSGLLHACTLTWAPLLSDILSDILATLFCLQDVDNAEGPATPRGDSATQARRFGSFLEQIHGVYNRTDKASGLCRTLSCYMCTCPIPLFSIPVAGHCSHSHAEGMQRMCNEAHIRLLAALLCTNSWDLLCLDVYGKGSATTPGRQVSQHGITYK
jgi:hypothetical protein